MLSQKRTNVILLSSMRHDREKVFELRKEGKSYREIQSIIKISRGTLCEWLKNENWSKHAKKLNTEKHIKISREHLVKLNESRKIRLSEQYAKVEQEAREEFEIHKKDPLFMAGLMLYAGEGEKTSKHHIKFANIEFDLHKIFINFATCFLKVDKKSIKCWILLYPDLDAEICKSKWSQELDIPFSNFYKPQVIQGKHKTKRLHFGVGSVIVSSSFLKRKLTVWLELAKKYLAHQTLGAAIV